MPYLPIVIVLACAVFFHRAAEFENESTLLWTGLSVLISTVTLFYFRWGILGALLGQAGLLAGITIFRLWRSRDL
jgi:uncharacterized membrane protein YGL010W